MEAEIYGPATVEQLKGGKHMKRSFEAFLTLYIALFQLYINQFLTENPEVQNDVRKSTTEAAVSEHSNIRKRADINCSYIHVRYDRVNRFTFVIRRI